MSTKQIIAVDIDDVLAANAQGFIDFTNEKWGTSLTLDDYDEHWGEVWKVELDETIQRSNEMHEAGVFERHLHFADAKPVLQKLGEKYRLVVVTSRRRIIHKGTMAWLQKYFEGIFEDVHFAGIWDEITEQSIHMTKGDILKKIGASYLIDDQLKHCLAADEHGVKSILFGDYTWNQSDELPKTVVRCSNWAAVERYFDEQK